MSGTTTGDHFELPILRPRVRDRVREAVEARHLLRATAASSVPTYGATVLGRTWLVIVPLMQIFGFSLLLGGVFHATAPNGVPYVIYLVFGFQAYRAFQLTLMYTTVSTKMLKTRTRTLRFPLLLIPFASIARTFLLLGISWVTAALVLLYYVIARGKFYLRLDARFFVGVAGLALVILFALSIGLTTSVIYPRARDVKYIVKYGMQFWMFFTPVVYSLDSLPASWRTVAELNPLTSLLGMVQYGFVGAGRLLPYGIAWSVAVICVTATFGLWFFNRYANTWVGVYSRSRVHDEEDEGDIL